MEPKLGVGFNDRERGKLEPHVAVESMTEESQSVPTSPDQAEREQRIRERAYKLWHADGEPEGRSEEYWHRARVLIEAEEHGRFSPNQSR
jgi:hypothetical protein